jgi:thymidylate kinase
VFIDRSQQYPQRIKLVDASVAINEVSQQIHDYLEQL